MRCFVLANDKIHCCDTTFNIVQNWLRNCHVRYPRNILFYAFIQHILKSLKEKTGRCAILLPHGVLSRNEEKEIRVGLVKGQESLNWGRAWVGGGSEELSVGRI